MSFSGISPTTLAYLAGILDGEGCFRISCRRNENYIAIVQVGMVEEAVPKMLQELFGGKIYASTLKSGRVIHRWHLLKCSEIANFIEAILPYLIVKKRQAEALLAFATCADASLNTGKRTHPQEVKRRRELFHIVKPLNAVGSAALKTAI